MFFVLSRAWDKETILSPHEEIGGAAYLREHLKKVSDVRVRSNAWLLSFDCCAHVLVVMQNSMEKLC